MLLIPLIILALYDTKVLIYDLPATPNVTYAGPASHPHDTGDTAP